jgi:hypothetical protein
LTVWLDTSVILRVLLKQGGALRSWRDWDAVSASEVLRVEARRVLDRLRLERALDDIGLAKAQEQLAEIEATISFVHLTRIVLERASGPMPTVVTTLDAIHLASALIYREQRDSALIFATHEIQQRSAAIAFGFPCVG